MNYSDMPLYEKVALSSLYSSLDFMKCNGLPTSEVLIAIRSIESKYTEA